MLKTVIQQGPRGIETGGGTDRTSWGRSPAQWILANGKTPSATPPSEHLRRYVEGLSDARTKLADFFSILSGVNKGDEFLVNQVRSFPLRDVPCLGDSDES